MRGVHMPFDNRAHTGEAGSRMRAMRHFLRNRDRNDILARISVLTSLPRLSYFWYLQTGD
jgi:hypothetical protein